jgi:hypothetical protein
MVDSGRSFSGSVVEELVVSADCGLDASEVVVIALGELATGCEESSCEPFTMRSDMLVSKTGR